MTHLRVLAAGLGICLVIGVIACGNGVPQPSTSSSGPAIGKVVRNQTAAATIKATDSLLFQPVSQTVHVNDVVEWTNPGSVVHTITFDEADLNNDTLQPGGTWQIQFTVAGTYKYKCTIHPGMNGTIVVS